MNANRDAQRPFFGSLETGLWSTKSDGVPLHRSSKVLTSNMNLVNVGVAAKALKDNSDDESMSLLLAKLNPGLEMDSGSLTKPRMHNVADDVGHFMPEEAFGCINSHHETASKDDVASKTAGLHSMGDRKPDDSMTEIARLRAELAMYKSKINDLEQKSGLGVGGHSAPTIGQTADNMASSFSSTQSVWGNGSGSLLSNSSSTELPGTYCQTSYKVDSGMSSVAPANGGQLSPELGPSGPALKPYLNSVRSYQVTCQPPNNAQTSFGNQFGRQGTVEQPYGGYAGHYGSLNTPAGISANFPDGMTTNMVGNVSGGMTVSTNDSSAPMYRQYSTYTMAQPIARRTTQARAQPIGQAMSQTMGQTMGQFPVQPVNNVNANMSPPAAEFGHRSQPWKTESLPDSGECRTYLPPTEPLNYRRLLERNVNCDWSYIVDKIVCNNDQQASIFLQQKLKVGTPEQKYEIVEAIVDKAYPLMINRFGNFLIQRCFEHGTQEQIVKIAEAIRGNTLNLSMDSFGCHVIQKAFDCVPEQYKAIMVKELLRRIPDTVIHRYACHVWQKLFELRWRETPPQIMKYVNEALQGMWHEVALGETGSLVVQNIFENCLEEDKRPCITEVLANIDVVAHGQFGNWCIQHICEHGAPADRTRAIDHVIRYAAEYSMDQFASKVVEKCLKIGGSEFLTRYLDRVCEGRPDRPRIPLIDIASDQYGNYLIQYILNHASPQHREQVAMHIRKHMVSLRGSKFGSRVGMLCTNPAVATRPGPGAGPGMSRVSGPRYGGGSYR